MKHQMSKEQAEAAAGALLNGTPRFSDTGTGRVLRHLRRCAPAAQMAQEGVSKMLEPNGFESPGSAQWGVMHRESKYD
jgi:hypothetical protein